MREQIGVALPRQPGLRKGELVDRRGGDRIDLAAAARPPPPARSCRRRRGRRPPTLRRRGCCGRPAARTRSARTPRARAASAAAFADDLRTDAGGIADRERDARQRTLPVSLLAWRHCDLHLHGEPLGDDLGAGVALERASSARSTAPNASRARSPVKARASASRSPVSTGLASTARSAPALIASRSRSIDAISRSTIARSSRVRSFFDARCAARAAACTRDCVSARPASVAASRIASIAEHRQIVVDQRQRLADAAVGERRGLARLAVAVIVIAHQRGGDLGGGQPSESQPHAARSHRRQQRAGHRGRQDEHRARRRLFERLEQRVLRRRSRACRPRGSAPRGACPRTAGNDVWLEHVADRLDLDRRALVGLERDDVDVHAARDAIAGAALAARVDRRGRSLRSCERTRDRVEAVDRLRRRARHGPFADARRARRTAASAAATPARSRARAASSGADGR